MFERALSLDPNFADAQAWLGLALYTQFADGQADRTILNAAIARVKQALAIDPDLLSHDALSSTSTTVRARLKKGLSRPSGLLMRVRTTSMPRNQAGIAARASRNRRRSRSDSAASFSRTTACGSPAQRGRDLVHVSAANSACMSSQRISRTAAMLLGN